MDENVHRAITEGLRLRGVDVLTVQDDGRRRLRDPVVLDRATELGRPLFSQDAPRPPIWKTWKIGSSSCPCRAAVPGCLVPSA
jgi:uncharacterized protein DUF5615